MRLARVTIGTDERAVAVGPDHGCTVLDVAGPDPLLTLLRDPRGLAVAADAARTDTTVPLADVHVLAPLHRPGKIIAVGLNYHDHTVETGLSAPHAPLTFAKYPSSVTGPYDDIVIPGGQTDRVDYEAELAVVIGRRCAPDGSADLGAIAAYTVANDVSARDVQFSDQQWTRAKSFDTFTPLGPWLVTADDVADPHDLHIWTRIGSTTLQDDRTSSLVFDIPALLKHLSSGTTLEPGDVVLTGTPSGAGAFADPPRYLAEGDVVEIGVEGIGTLRNVVRVEA